MALSLEEGKAILREDTPAYAKAVLKIVDDERRLVPLIPKAAQLRFDAALEEQRAKGTPMRAIVLKARQIGFSTWVQAKVVQRITQREHHNALIVAHNKRAAGNLFDIGERMWRNLPDDPAVEKPTLTNTRKSNYLYFGESESSLTVDTASELQAGRGETYSELHCSEVAFWPDIETKLNGLLSTVPDSPESLIVIESTANGYNHFRKLWVDAMEGRSGYVPFFSPWHEDPRYRKPFISDDEKAAFIGTIGRSPYGEQEPKLIEEFDLDYEQLNWRRATIASPRFSGDLRKFAQEYPSSWSEAFIATGSTVFAPNVVQVVLERTESTDPDVPTQQQPGPDSGTLKPGGYRKRQGKIGLIEIPENPVWVPREGIDPDSRWKVWAHPQKREEETPEGRYVVSFDPASGEESDHGELAEHAIEVIDHRTREQVAEYGSRLDPDEVADQVLLAALYWNNAWVVIERTGGWGLSSIRRLRWDYLYPFMYKRRPQDVASMKEEDRLGWETQRATKPLLEDGMKEMLREGTDGIRSRTLALQMTTYVKDQRGRTGPMKNEFADRLMAYMIGQEIAQQLPVKPDRQPGPRRVQTGPPRFPRVGYR